tara:strand:+ start:467 stop:973 length:507 start_codon:yes stop_codon:yes gene_type:complete
MIPIFITNPFSSKYRDILDLPITWQVPILILISVIFGSSVVIKAFTIYLIIGLFILPIFPHGGSLGYLLTPNFGYLIGMYPLIMITDILYKKNKLYFFDFLRTGIFAICSMHIIGIIYCLLQMLYYRQMDNFFYSLGSYTFGKIIYHFLMLLPLSLLIKPINYFKYRS